MPPYTPVTSLQPAEGRRDFGSWNGKGTSVAMSYGAVSLDDEYVSSLRLTGQLGGGSKSPRRTCCAYASWAPGTRFISGISYYTYYLSDALQETFNVSVVLMRRLLAATLLPREKAGRGAHNRHRDLEHRSHL